MPLDQHPAATHPETTTCQLASSAALHAVFIADERPAYLGLLTGVRCVLPTGDVVEVCHRRTPLYDLARELQTQGYGDCRLESFTPTGTPSLRGLVKVMAGLTVEEGPSGLKRRKYRPAKWCESATDSREAPRGTQTPENEEKRVSESTAHEKAA